MLTMKFAFAIATITALQQAAVAHTECDFGSNYTSYFNNSYSCSFDVGVGIITLSSESNTISSGDTNVTTTTERRNMAIWNVVDKESTVQCYDIMFDEVSTAYPNGSEFYDFSGDVYLAMGSENVTFADGVAPLPNPGFYLFKGGHVEFMRDEIETGGHYWTYFKAEGDDVTDLCEVLGAAPAPTPTPPSTEAPSSGKMAALTIIPCITATMLNYFFSFSL